MAFVTFAAIERDKKQRAISPLRSKTLWARITKNPDCSTGPLAYPFARLLAPLTRSLAPDCSLRSRPPLRSLVRSLACYGLLASLAPSAALTCSLVRSLAHFAHSFARGTVNDWMAILSVFFSIFDHSGVVERGGDSGEMHGD